MPRHKPVLLEKTIETLQLKAGEIVVDGTLGSAGHAKHLAEQIGPTGQLIGLDQDPVSIDRCREILKDYPQAVLRVANFVEIEKVLEELNILRIDAVLIDTGFSSDQLEDPERGLSFERNGPLDMRLGPYAKVQAKDLVNDLSQLELERIFLEYGEERYSRSFARVICESRELKRIETTFDLIEVMAKTLPKGFRIEKGRRPRHQRHHFATRIFQALRIAVNQELEILEKGLNLFWNRLNYNGRIVVITFHSLEDRIVKRFFREKKDLGEGILIHKKAVQATWQETKENPRARSAKLRGIQKL